MTPSLFQCRIWSFRYLMIFLIFSAVTTFTLFSQNSFSGWIFDNVIVSKWQIINYTYFDTFISPYTNINETNSDKTGNMINNTEKSLNENETLFSDIENSTRLVLANLSTSETNPADDFACHIPQFDINDKSILKYVKKMPRLNCGHKNIRSLTYLDYDGILYINKTVVDNEHLSIDDISECYWQTAILKQDNHMTYGKRQSLSSSQKVTNPCVYVACVHNKNDPWYENVHIYVDTDQHSRNDSEDRVSVFILAIDSMSRANFIRQMPLTYKYIINEAGASLLNGLTKVADNTFPNIITILSGLRASYKGSENELPYPRHILKKSFADDLPLLWFSYRNAGYTTMYAEDMPQFGLFTYASKGFEKQPVTHYMRPFWVTSETTKLHKKSEWYCYGNSPKHMLILNYCREYLYKHQYTPSFGFGFISEITHGEINRAQQIDADVYSFLREMHENNITKNTILVVMGDHGNRFDKIRITTIGRLEERLPFFSIMLPRSLSESFPHLKTTLQENKDALTSWFDFHEMLVDVERKDFVLPVVQPRSSRYGISLWRQLVPHNRTCAAAGVLDEYCVCNREVTLRQPYDEVITSAAKSLVSAVNELLKPAKTMCQTLLFKKVINAAMVFPSNYVLQPGNHNTTLRIAVEVKPSAAILEGLIWKYYSEKSWHVHGDILRINEFGEQSHCIDSARLRLYCICKES